MLCSPWAPLTQGLPSTPGCNPQYHSSLQSSICGPSVPEPQILDVCVSTDWSQDPRLLLGGERCAKRSGQGHESRGVQGRGRKGSAWGCQPVPFLCRQSVIRAQAMAESPRALLLQSQHRTRVPTPFISPASPVGEASVHSCAPDPAGDTPSVNLPTCPCGGQAVLGGFLLGDGLSLSPWRTAVELR